MFFARVGLNQTKLPLRHKNMFFPSKIQSIKRNDRVLEIGPGATPYFRANEFLEYRFADLETIINQRGNVQGPPDFGNRKVSYYDGDAFPFQDNEFDYVIASQVIEHTPNPKQFMSEVFRVGGGRGYLEFPLPAYEYLFDFDVHLSYVWFDADAGALKYVKKRRDMLDEFSSLTSGLRRGLEQGWDDLVRNNLTYFMQGIEFSKPFTVSEAPSLRHYQREWENSGNTVTRKVIRKIESLLPK